ncbi:hypothetical protein FRZ67_16015 [Panacibacter ginsenosidivorans]|uniref:Uncharacterized protein n=1 Tax=Panacibacter ginsenosidivorans TaxID=1813871 RepID=A0A5B8VDL5_9BACT|nr:hypothetical protein [Panacibacter ginsenosidivorans]QEC68736.1 hypothetical protein FRZ67_16015 [Panacibacter ginsenosidivorans]
MKADYLQLWNLFKSSLLEALKETNTDEFDKGWSTSPQRTLFYFDTLLPKVAKKMNLKYELETFFRVDITFYKEAGQTSKIPIVYIESENDVRTTEGEVIKLCRLNAPLKIIMVVNDWNDSSKKIISEGFWEYIIEDFKDESLLTGYFAFIIGERNNGLKFYSYVYNELAEIIEDKLLVEI